MKFWPIKLPKVSWKAIALLYGALFLFILFRAYTGTLPPQLAQIPFYDKIGHVVLYCLAAYLGHQLLKRRHIQVLFFKLPLFPLMFVVFTSVEEGLQTFSPNRTLDAIDLIASFFGIGLGYWLAEKGK
jgi:polysaccharide biosynthesis protein VpsQ